MPEAQNTIQVAGAAIFLVLAVVAHAGGDAVLLSMGQPIPLELAHHLNSAQNPPGSVVFLRVSEDVVVRNRVVVKKGAWANGTVGETKKSKSFGRAGAMTIRLRSLRAVDGSIVPLEGDFKFRGEGQGGGSLTTGILFGVVGGFLVKGKVASLPKAAELTAYVAADRDVEFLVEDERVVPDEIEYFVATVEPQRSILRFDFSRRKEFPEVVFRVEPPEGYRLSDLNRRSIHVASVQGEVLPEAVEMLRPNYRARDENRKGKMDAFFPAWPVVSFCDLDKCEVGLRGELYDGEKWLATTSFVLEARD